MATTHSKVKGSKSASIKSIALPKRALDAIAFIESCPDAVKEWEQWELDFVKTWYGRKRFKDIAKALGYTTTKVRTKVNNLISSGFIKEKHISPYSNRKNSKL